MSGDEDVRVGVQIAQNYGVRIHLLGIEPSRGSQSKALLQEADTKSEWTKATVAKFLSIRTLPSKSSATGTVLAIPASPELRAPSHAAAPVARAIAEQIEWTAEEFVDELLDGDVKSLLSFSKSQRRIPPEFDGRLLARCRSTLERDPDTTEKKFARAKFTDAVRAKADIATSDSR